MSDEELPKNNDPIDGQIGIEEMALPPLDEDETGFMEPISGQIGLEELTYAEFVDDKDEQRQIEEGAFEQEIEQTQEEEELVEDMLEQQQDRTDRAEAEEAAQQQEILEEEEPFEEEPAAEYIEQVTRQDADIKEETAVEQENIEETEEPEQMAKLEDETREETAEKADEPEKVIEKEKIVRKTQISISKAVNTIKISAQKQEAINKPIEQGVSELTEKDEIEMNNAEEGDKVSQMEELVGADEETAANNEEVEHQSFDFAEDEPTEIAEKIVSDQSGEDVVDGMLYRSLDQVLHDSMIPYSEHVILDRALPRVEDGLKPVQRRILYSMLELGVTPDKAFRKSARIVGDCMGKYHPHGDSSVYDAMVRMAQPYNTNGLLIEGHGNFGSIDGDSAAAMRYTEARMAPLAMELLRDLEKDTVKWNFNFDDTLKEPDVLPGRFPNILVNGTTGIAVGLATNIPPHNLAEVIDGVCAYIDHPKITLKEMMKIIKAPDFPTGGYILSNSEIEQAYATGRGRIIMRAKIHIETDGADKRNIVITEIPYQTNKAAILQKIAVLREDGKNVLSGVADIRDESDRKGIRAVVKVKKDADIKAICDFLFKYTNLQTTFGVNMVAIAGGKPKQMSLLEILEYYVDYQREVVLRRSKYELEEAKEREHILSGLLIAIRNIDAVIKIIKTSPNTTTARQRLREKFNLSERQAQAILDMRLARLTSLEVFKLEEEIKQLQELIKKLTAIVNSKKLQFDLVKSEMLAIKKQYKKERQTVVMKNAEVAIPSDQDKKATQEVYIAVNAMGNIKIINRKFFLTSIREFRETSTLAEAHNILVPSDTDKFALVFTNLGNCYKIPVRSIPESRFKDKGTPPSKVIKDMSENERVIYILSTDEETLPKGNLLFFTKSGMVKRTDIKEYGLLKSSFAAAKLKDDDEIIGMDVERDGTTLLFVTKDGMVLNAGRDDVPLQGRISGGVKGINLGSGDYCVFAGQTSDEGEVVMLTDKAYAKRVVVSSIDVMARYRKGLRLMPFGPNGSKLVFADTVTAPYYIVGEAESTLYGRNTDLVVIESRTGKGKIIEKGAGEIINGHKYLIE
ncbi:MAG: DNA topoisomerase 4 subunit A [Christensenellaceae bacterium]|jgi:DNA gyrase subunit A|nr:DNA topoisomerase 4 subunit A [Christensenellaceae bacterium]